MKYRLFLYAKKSLKPAKVDKINYSFTAGHTLYYYKMRNQLLNWRSVEQSVKCKPSKLVEVSLSIKWLRMRTCQPTSTMIRKKSWFPWAQDMVGMMTIFVEEVSSDVFPKYFYFIYLPTHSSEPLISEECTPSNSIPLWAKMIFFSLNKWWERKISINNESWIYVGSCLSNTEK